MTNFEKVGLFMKTFGQEVKNKTELSTAKINLLRTAWNLYDLNPLSQKFFHVHKID